MPFSEEQILAIRFMVSPRGRAVVIEALNIAIEVLKNHTTQGAKFTTIADMKYILDTVYKPDVDVMKLLGEQTNNTLTQLKKERELLLEASQEQRKINGALREEIAVLERKLEC